jgi:peptidyl-prolyl cis-trans isomerase D
MLDIMRRKQRLKLVLWLVIISLGFGMLVLFVPRSDIGTQAFDTYAASVAGDTISVKEFADAYQRMVNNYTNNGKNKVDAETLKRLGVDRQVLQSLVQERVVTYEAKLFGLDVTPDEVRQAIESNPGLRNQNGFIGVDAYKEMLASNRIDLAQFEEEEQHMLLARKLMDLLTDSISIPESYVRENFARQNQEAQAQYVLFDKEAAKKRINPAETELHSYFDANKDKYHIKEERRVQYLLLPIAEVASTIKVTDQEIDETWNQSDHPEKVEASRILFKVDDPSKDAEVKTRAEAILKRAKAGDNFADLAKKNSQDEASAPQGGTLGQIPKGQEGKAFDDVAFALKPGEVSDLVRTERGYEIIKVTRHEIPTLESSRPSVIHDIQIEKATEIVKQKAEEAQKLAEKQSDLAAIAGGMSVPTQMKETGFLNQSADAFANGVSQEFLDEIFSLKEINSVGKAVQVPAGFALPKLLKVNPPRPAEFKDVQEAVKKDYLDQKATELLQADAKKLCDEAKKQSDLTKAAQKQGLAVKTSSSFKRDAAPAPEIGSAPDFTSAAFNLPVGGISDPITIGGGKQIAVLQVKTKRPLNEAEYQKQKSALRDQALGAAKEAYFEEFLNRAIESLQKAKKIRVNQQAIDQIVGSYR